MLFLIGINLTILLDFLKKCLHIINTNCILEKGQMENNIKILLIDEDIEFVEIIKHRFRPAQNKNFEVVWVKDGQEGLDNLKSDPTIDLILLDYFLPKSNGIEVVKEIFNSKIIKPIILLTSHKDFRIAIEAMKYGVEDYLIKEEMIDTLLPRTVLSILERFQVNKRLLETEKEKMILEKRMEAVQELIVTMCHEFNNPLAAIKISTDILLRQSKSDEQKNILTKFNDDITHLEKQIIKLRDINIDK